MLTVPQHVAELIQIKKAKKIKLSNSNNNNISTNNNNNNNNNHSNQEPSGVITVADKTTSSYIEDNGDGK